MPPLDFQSNNITQCITDAMVPLNPPTLKKSTLSFMLFPGSLFMEVHVITIMLVMTNSWNNHLYIHIYIKARSRGHGHGLEMFFLFTGENDLIKC